MTRGPRLSDRDIDAIVRVISAHPEGISRAALVAEMNDYRRMRDSVVRVAIENARARGELIVWDGASKVYRMARSAADVEVWIARENEPRALRLHEQARAMRARCAVTFPPQQMRLGAA